MVESSFSATLEESLALLKSFSGVTPKGLTSENEKQRLRQAICQIVTLSEGENLGICADTVEEALDSLTQYLQALAYPPLSPAPDLPHLTEAVYLKYNTQKQRYYLDRYSGEYRGVLLAIQGEYESITGTYGYFPLDLFKD